MAQRLKAIAEHPIIANTKHVSLLPSCWGTLYELTKLPNDMFMAKLKNGSIHPKLERKHARALRRPEGKRNQATRKELIAAIQNDPTANQRDAASALGVGLGMYQRIATVLHGRNGC